MIFLMLMIKNNKLAMCTGAHSRLLGAMLEKKSTKRQTYEI